MSGHTTGPWKLVSGGEVWAGGTRIIMGRGSYDEKERSKRDANARLIAAAPALLEALKVLAHLADVLNSRQHAGLDITPVMWSTLFDDTNKARAAIQAAEGRE